MAAHRRFRRLRLGLIHQTALAKSKRLLILVFCLGFGVQAAEAQDVQLFLHGQADSFTINGGSQLGNSVIFRIGYRDPTGQLTLPIFDQLSWTTADVGKTVTITAANDSNFSGFVSLLTDGMPEEILNDVDTSAYMFSGNYDERVLTILLPNNPVDFHGYRIDSLSLQLTSLSLSPYQGQTSFVFSGNGVAVPEPSALLPVTLLAAGVLRRRRLTAYHACSR